MNQSVAATDPADAADSELPEQIAFRAAKRSELLAAGTEAYPPAVPRTHRLAQVRAQWGHLELGAETADVVSVAGRVMFLRNTGKLCFATIQDGFTPNAEVGQLQVMISLAEVGAAALADWKHVVDLGDQISVTGRVISSRRGELSVLATSWQLAAKALRPLPTLHKELAEESRVRQRHTDLIVRAAARDMVRARAAVTRSFRETLHRNDFLEIETPVLQLVHGGATARPFQTHLNAFNQPMSLRIALELYLKRAIVGGVDRVYEIGRVFRNEGVDSSHSPEFTMLEAYQSWGDQHSIAQLTQELILDAADALGSRVVTSTDRTGNPVTIDLGGTWEWVPVYPRLSQQLGEEVTPDTPAEELRRYAEQNEVGYDPAWNAEKLIMELFSELVEPTLIQPTFVCDYPPAAQPLARAHRSEPGKIEAWDLIINGVERGTGFTELIDPVVQRERLTAQSLLAAAGDPEAMQVDEDFLQALEVGSPPIGGVGLGLDRIMMLFTGAGIRETILFPLLKPG